MCFGQDVAMVSTPPQLEDFVRRVSLGQVSQPASRRFCFDLDRVRRATGSHPGGVEGRNDLFWAKGRDKICTTWSLKKLK